MNNNDMSTLIKMINNMDQRQLSNTLNQLNKMLSNEDKMKIMQALNGKK